MSKLIKVLLIWGGVFLGICLMYLASPRDGSVTSVDSKIFLVLLLGAVCRTIAVIGGKDTDD